MIKFMEVLEDLNCEEKRWVYANLYHIIERFNEKFNKNISLTL